MLKFLQTAAHRVHQTREVFQQLLEVCSELCYRQTLATQPRYGDRRSLTRHGAQVYSQNDEDGILDEIFRRIGTTNRLCVEFGVGHGLENNTLYRVLQGWQAVWFEACSESAVAIERGMEPLIRQGRIRFQEALVSVENIVKMFERQEIPTRFDLLSIDIDGNDYWLWNALRHYRPRVVVIEYNASYGPIADCRMEYDPNWKWNGQSRGYGASLKALEQLGRELGYRLVGCNFTGVNAFFVETAAAADLFPERATSEDHFEPPRYDMSWSSGWERDYDEISRMFGMAPAAAAREPGWIER